MHQPQQPDHGQPLRLARGETEVIDGVAILREPVWRFDKMLLNSQITREQWWACVHWRWWQECQLNSHLRCISLETTGIRTVMPLDDIYIDRLTALDKFVKSARLLKKECKIKGVDPVKLVMSLAVDDMTITGIAKTHGIRKANAAPALDYLTPLNMALDGKPIKSRDQSTLESHEKAAFLARKESL